MHYRFSVRSGDLQSFHVLRPSRRSEESSLNSNRVPKPAAAERQSSRHKGRSKRSKGVKTTLHPAVLNTKIFEASSLGDLHVLLNSPKALLSPSNISPAWQKLVQLSEVGDGGESLPMSAMDGRTPAAWQSNFSNLNVVSVDSFEGDWEYNDVEDEYSDDGDDLDFNPLESSWTREQLLSLREQRLRRSSSYSASSSSSSSYSSPSRSSSARRPHVHPRVPRSSPEGSPISYASSAALALGSVAKHLARITAPHVGKMQPRSLSITMACMAKLRLLDPKLLAALLDASHQQLSHSTPLAVSNMIWACAMLKHQPPVSWLDAAVLALQYKIDELRPDQLCTITYCFGKLNYTPDPEWTMQLCDQLSETELRALTPADLTRLVTGLAAMQQLPQVSDPKARPSAGKRQTASQILPLKAYTQGNRKSDDSSPPRLSGLSDAWFRTYLEVTESRLLTYNATGLCQTAKAMTAFRGELVDQWLVSFYKATSLSFSSGSELSASHATAIILALAELNSRPAIVWLNDILSTTRPSLKNASCAELVSLANGLAMLRFRAGEGWLRSFLAATFGKLPFFSATQCCALLAALGRLGQRPPSVWLGEVARCMRKGMAELSGQHLADALCALVRMGYRPEQTWLVDFEKHTHSKLNDADSISADGLAETAGALAQVRYKPQMSWLYSLMLSAYRRLDNFSAPQLSLFFRALPRISQAGWLDELVQICASETSGSMRSRSGSGSYDDYDVFFFNDASSAGPSSSSERNRAGVPPSASSFASAAARAARAASESGVGSNMWVGFSKAAKKGAPPAPSRSTKLWSGLYLNDGSYDEADYANESGEGSQPARPVQQQETNPSSRSSTSQSDFIYDFAAGRGSMRGIPGASMPWDGTVEPASSNGGPSKMNSNRSSPSNGSSNGVGQRDSSGVSNGGGSGVTQRGGPLPYSVGGGASGQSKSNGVSPAAVPNTSEGVRGAVANGRGILEEEEDTQDKRDKQEKKEYVSSGKVRERRE
eukprot:gene7781-968_t